MSEELIIDNFRLANCLASGSSSQIWEVFDQETNERYAMKLLLDEAFKQAEDKAVLKREFKIAQGFDHPNLMPVYVHRQSRKNAYFVMEYFSGPNLKQLIRGDVVVIHARFRKLFECVLMGLNHIHEKGWLHRDIKPDNIMMTKSTDVRLIDFSLSTKAPSSLSRMFIRKVKQIQGTRTYIAPEIVRRKLPSIQTDIYSLGITMFECLTGRAPFMGSTPNELLIKHIQEAPPEPANLNPNVTPEMSKLVLRMLAKKPENRPAGVSELLAEFRSVKIFKEDPEDLARQKAQDEEISKAAVVEGQLDSRADAARQELRKTEGGGAFPETTASKPAVTKPAPAKPAPAPAAKQNVPNQPPQQQPMRPAHPGQQGQPGQPGQMMPGMPPQGWPYGQQPMPGGYPYPQQPGYQQMPPGAQPRPGNPQRPAPPQGQPAAQRPPGQPAPQQSQPRPQQPGKPPAPPAQKSPQKQATDEMPFADELPDIL